MVKINLNRRQLRFLLLYILWLVLPEGVMAQASLILPNGHAHNDYARDKPLYEALSYGFTSIEVDVFLYNGKLVVTHDAFNLSAKPTIDQLYLDPLKTIIRHNGGTVYKNDSIQLVLMIDLKSEKMAAWQALRELFKNNYLNLIERRENERLIWGPVKVLLSGGPPVEEMQKQKIRYFSADGRFEQWAEDYSPDLMPRASDSYRKHFNWNGKGQMPEAELLELNRLVALAHAHGRKIRLWGCPDTPQLWRTFLDHGVDWINVDNLKGFHDLYRSRSIRK